MADKMNKIKFNSDMVVPNLTISGNLNVAGTSIAESTENILTKGAVTVINADNNELNVTLMGTVIRTGKQINGKYVDYAMVYDPLNESVRLGIGEYNSESNTFAFNEGEGLPIAVRDLGTDDGGRLVMWDAENYRLVKAPLQKGISENSIQQTGCIAGLKGFYWSDIDINAKTITLATVNGSYGTEQTFILVDDYWAVGDIVSIHNNFKWENCSKITAINGNEITVDTLPFTSLKEESGHITDQAVYVLTKPDKGLCDFGQNSVSFGYNCKATNYSTTAFGRENNAYGQYAFAAGRNNSVSYASFASGRENDVSGEQSFASGYKNVISGNDSFASGKENKVSGMCAFASGYSSEASGDYAHAEGNGTVASGESSHAEGYNAGATYKYAHAEGCGTKASGYGAHSEGNVTEASGAHSHSEGKKTKAKGESSHAEGANGIASGPWSHIEGYGTNENTHVASGNYSHVEGKDNKATAAGAHVQGRECTASGIQSHAGGYHSTAMSDYSFAHGNNTVSGGKGFKFSRIDAANKKFTLVKADGSNLSLDEVTYEVGDEYSFIFVHNYNTANGDSETYSANCKADFIGKITSVQMEADGSVTVTVDTLHYTVKGDAVIADKYADSCLFFVPTKPTIGDIEIGQNAVTTGIDNTNVGYASLIGGEGNINSGMYALMGGKYNKGGYGGLIGGRDNDGSANYVTVGGTNHKVKANRGAAFNLANEVLHENGTCVGEHNKTSAPDQFVGGKFANPSTNALLTMGNGKSETERANAFEVIVINGVTYLRLNNTSFTAEGNSFYIYGCSAEDYGVSFGTSSKSAIGALSFGEQGKALGYCSFSGGRKTIAKEQFQTALGMFNADNANALFMVGNGKSDTVRSNAFEVLKNGTAFLGGKKVATVDQLGGQTTVQIVAWGYDE